MILLAAYFLLVEVVGDTVAVTAFRELDHHASRMGNAMALLTFGHRLVFCLMTGSTIQLAVFGCACNEQVIGLAMARGTVLVRNIFRIFYLQRHMGPMAGEAIGLGHLRAMGFMALLTLRNKAVLVVAIGAGQSRMLARILLQLCNLLRMAGKTRLGYVA